MRTRERLVLHVHADEQPREIEDCVAEHGLRPIELLAETGCLGPRTTIVHATHASDARARPGRRLRAHGVCVCPTTEANLGDGFAPVARLLERGIGLSIGSDSNVRIDPFEELRELEGIARRQELRRNVIGPDELLRIGSEGGAAALGLTEWDGIEIDLTHRSLDGVSPDEVRGRSSSAARRTSSRQGRSPQRRGRSARDARPERPSAGGTQRGSSGPQP